MDPEQLKADGRSLYNMVIQYPEEINSETGRKKYMSKLLREHPETLRADFKMQCDQPVITDLHRGHRMALHTP